jgi:hypothetical protein
LQGLLACVAIALVSLGTTSGFALAELMGYNETTIHVVSADQNTLPDSGEFCQAYGIYSKDLLVRDMQGNVITKTKVGSQVMFESTVVNSCIDQDNALSITLFEVRDANDITIYLTWQDTTIDSRTNDTRGASWVAPEVPGEYTVRSFHISCLQCTGLIHDIQEYPLTVSASENCNSVVIPITSKCLY